MASSCLYVIERIGKILNHVPTYAYIPDDFTKIKNLDLLHTLYEYVKEEQKKNGGIFNGSTLSKGYWGKSFCSSAIKNYMDYLIETYDGASPVRESHITQHIQEPMQKITYGAPVRGSRIRPSWSRKHGRRMSSARRSIPIRIIRLLLGRISRR